MTMHRLAGRPFAGITLALVAATILGGCRQNAATGNASTIKAAPGKGKVVTFSIVADGDSCKITPHTLRAAVGDVIEWKTALRDTFLIGVEAGESNVAFERSEARKEHPSRARAVKKGTCHFTAVRRVTESAASDTAATRVGIDAIAAVLIID